MKNFIEIIIRPNGLTLCDPTGQREDEFVDSQEASLDARLIQFRTKHEISTTTVALFVAEELLYFKSLELPLKTPNLKDAIRFQLGLLTPFAGDDVLYSFTTTRTKDMYQVALYATPRQHVQPYLQSFSDAGFTLIGLFPESQRYVNRTRRRERWALMTPGRFAKAIVFAGTHMENRFLCGSEPEFADLATLCATKNIYHPQPLDNDGFMNATLLREKSPLLKEFDLLPPAYKKPDYSRAVIIALLILNLISLLGLAGIKQYRLTTIEQQLEAEIQEILPKVNEINTLFAQEKQLTEDIEKIKELSDNPDLITLLQRLTEELPETSFLDQLRMIKGKHALEIQGYTEDIGELTNKLQTIGQTKLKSTSRRRNETYFQMEIGLP
jgi:hypothetical protein